MGKVALDEPGFAEKVKLCGMLLFRPARFAVLAKTEWDERARLGTWGGTLEIALHADRTERVRSAFWGALRYVLASGAIGCVLAVASARTWSGWGSVAGWLQIGGGAVLLWATLFVRGWEIQSCGPVPTLPERVNQWLYRGLAVLGTVLAVWGTVWQMRL